MRNRVAALIAGILLAGATANAQDVRATITGVVSDPTGAAMAGTAVRVTSLDRGTVTEAVTNETGRYLVQFLNPGA